MLEQLSKQDELWYYYALQICKDSYLARDLVNDMYLKVHDKNIEIKGDGKIYVYRILKSIYLNQLKKAKIKTLSIDEAKNVAYQETTVRDRYNCLEILKDVDIYTKEILLTTHEMSLRDAEKELEVAYYTLNYYKNKGLNKLRKKYG